MLKMADTYFSGNRTVIDCRFSCCATCSYWSGHADFEWPSNVVIDQNKNTKGKCNKTYLGHDTEALSTCSYWDQRY